MEHPDYPGRKRASLIGKYSGNSQAIKPCEFPHPTILGKLRNDTAMSKSIKTYTLYPVKYNEAKEGVTPAELGIYKMVNSTIMSRLRR